MRRKVDGWITFCVCVAERVCSCTSIVDEHIQPRLIFQKGVCEGADRLQTGEVQVHVVDFCARGFLKDDYDHVKLMLLLWELYDINESNIHLAPQCFTV